MENLFQNVFLIRNVLKGHIVGSALSQEIILGEDSDKNTIPKS
jgi:hypothetical protein